MSRVEPNRNVYLGLRYVPKIFGEWDKKNEYEGLSIVTHQGASYTSKKRVPVGIDILNEEFWVVTGNYNAQVEYYRDEVRDLSDYVGTELDKKVEKAYVDTELAKKSDQTYVDNELDKKANQTYVDTELGKKIYKDELMVNVKDHGAKGDGGSIDNDGINKAIQNVKPGGILRFPTGTYIIDADGSGYNGQTDAGIMVKKPMTIIFDQGAVLKAKPTDSPGYAVLRVIETEKVSIIGGKIVGERHDHTGSTGEWGHGLKIEGSKNVVVKDLTIEDCWGDGASITRGLQIGVYSENIIFDNVILNGNRRNGLTVGGAKNIVLRHSTFSNTSGTMPEAGIDIEPDGSSISSENVVIDGCNFFGNTTQDVVFGGGNGSKDVKIVNSNFLTEAMAINVLSDSDTALISNCFIKTKKDGIRLITPKNILITDTIIKSINTDTINMAFTLRSETGVTIEGCSIEDFGILLEVTGTLNHLTFSNNTIKNIRNDFFRTSENECNYAKINNNKMVNVNATYSTNVLNDSVFNGNDYIKSNIRARLTRCILKNNSFRDFSKSGISGATLNETIITSNFFESNHLDVYAVINSGRNDPHEQNIIYSNVSKNITPAFMVADTDMVQDNIEI